MMNSKKIVCSLIFAGGLINQTAAQLAFPLPAQDEKHTKIHIAAGEGLQRHGSEISLVLMGDFMSDVHLGAIGDHDIGGELGIILKDGEKALFVAPKIELLRVMGCKLFIKENIEVSEESLHFVPGGVIEVPLRVGTFHGHCFVSGLMDQTSKHETILVLEMGVTANLK